MKNYMVLLVFFLDLALLLYGKTGDEVCMTGWSRQQLNRITW